MTTKEARVLSIVVPPGWYLLNAKADRKQELEKAARYLTRRSPQDSAPVAREKAKAFLSKALETADVGGDGAIHALLFPTEAVGGIVLPATIAIAAMPPPEVDLTPVEVLVGASMANPTAVPVPVGDTVALRTHAIQPVDDQAGAAAEELLAVESDGSESARAALSALSLRTNYVFGWNEPTPEWYAVMCTAMMPAEEASDQLIAEYHGLFDAIVSGLGRPAGDPE